jgi:hypothetical protein
VGAQGLSNLVGSAVVAIVLAACSSLPDLQFDEDGGTTILPDGAVVAKCTCQTPPEGWTPLSFAPSSRPTCPGGTNAVDLRVASGDGSPSCSCTCGDVGGSCKTGNYTLTVSGELTCAIAPATASVPVDVAACTALPSPITVPNPAFAKVALPSPTSCGATSSLKTPLTDGRLCEPAPATACTAGQLCAATSGGGFTACIAKPGQNACPSDFPKRSTVGTAADTSKACVGCACGAPTACTGGTVSVFDNGGCKTNGAMHGATGIASACAATSDSGFTASHFKSTAGSGGCAPTPTTQPAPGTLSFTNIRTVCCK